MKMIPSFPHKTDSTGERRVFDLLRAAFEHDQNSDLTAFHSLNITRHAYKRFGEIDFVIVGGPGVLVLEVKGGALPAMAVFGFRQTARGSKAACVRARFGRQNRRCMGCACGSSPPCHQRSPRSSRGATE